MNGQRILRGSGGWTLCALLALTAAPATAQVIPLKTVPIATGDQFAIFPSNNAGMGGASIALGDSLHDPFVNPAKGRWVRRPQLFASPGLYDVSGDNGSARGLAAGSLFGSPRWFGGIAFALQQMSLAERPGFFFPLDGSGEPLSEKSASNTYAFGLVGAEVPGSHLSIGASLFWADLGAVEGVELLYPNAQRIDQFGDALDVRLGLLSAWEDGRTFEALVLYTDFDMTHEVTFVEFVVLPEDSLRWQPQVRVEENLDRTETWGLHLGGMHPFGDEGWRIGGILTGNWKSHPKLPNYELMNIPRDPGNSSAYNIGFGFAKDHGRSVFAVDVVYQPARVHTWAEAAEPDTTASGKVIPTGGKTVDNAFRFSNAHMRLGLRHDEDNVGFQLGLGVSSIRYRLEQKDLVAETRRSQREDWTEWTPTWGVSVKFPEVEIRYFGRVTSGVGRPGIASPIWLGGARAESPVTAADFLPAPTGPLTLDDASVWTHRFIVSIPLHR